MCRFCRKPCLLGSRCAAVQAARRLLHVAVVAVERVCDAAAVCRACASLSAFTNSSLCAMLAALFCVASCCIAFVRCSLLVDALPSRVSLSSAALLSLNSASPLSCSSFPSIRLIASYRRYSQRPSERETSNLSNTSAFNLHPRGKFTKSTAARLPPLVPAATRGLVALPASHQETGSPWWPHQPWNQQHQSQR